MTNYKLLLAFFSLMIILSIAWFCNRSNETKELSYYLPGLEKYKTQDIKYKKILADPAYDQPYVICISFKINNSDSNDKILTNLGLNKIRNLDTIELKHKTWNDEFKNFFTMHSFNSTRNSSLLHKEQKIEWWNPVIDSKATFACFFYDNLYNCKPVSFNERHNGKIACCEHQDRFYILIEAWML